MKLSGHYISVVVLIVLSQGVMWAQLNIVGVNTEKPISRINYLEQPLNIDKYLDNEVDMRNGVIEEINGYNDYNRYTMPQGQLLYHTRDCFPPFLKKNVFSDLQLAFRVKGDSLIIGFPKGYYKLVGMLLTKEDMAPFSNLKKFYYVNKNNEILSDKEVATMIDEQAQYDFWEMERSCRHTLNWVLEHTLSINELKEEIANDRISNLNVPVYLLENPQGVIYYTVNKYWFDGKSHLVNVEFVNKIMSLFKGKRFYIAGCPYLRDFYTNHKIKVQPADGIFSSDGDFWDGLNCVKKFEQTHSYLCKDIVIDGDKILGIFEWDNNTIVQELPNSFYKSTFSLRDDKDRVIYKSTIHFLGNKWNSTMLNFTMLSEDELSRLKKDCIKAQSLGSQSQAAKDALIAREQAAHKRAILDKYGAEYGDKIMKHQLALGMTPEMCKESIGWPSRTYKITTAFVETLVYYYAYMAVYFENEKLTRIEEVH